MNTILVSDVRHAEGRLPVATLNESLRVRSQRGYEACACNLPNLVQSTDHAFVSAVHFAFTHHYPLILSPDDVWLCLAQGFAIHVKLHAEELRGRFVSHTGKKEIKMRRNSFVSGLSSNDWPGVFAELSQRIHMQIGDKRELVVANFSTTGPVERAASEIVLFDAVQSYFDFNLKTMCGIPLITLLGSAGDWQSIRKRAENFAEFGLSNWTRALLPVLDRIVHTVQGDVDSRFWHSFYKWNNLSGGPYVTGWINVFFPYLQALEDLSSQPRPWWNELVTIWEDGTSARFGGGPSMDCFPTGISLAPFKWLYLGKTIPMVFAGGFVGVSQDVQTGAVRPAIGWAVGKRRIS